MSLYPAILFALCAVPVEVPHPTPLVPIYVLLDRSEASAGLRRELAWSADPYDIRHRYIDVNFRPTVLEWEEIPSFTVPGIPSWRVRYGRWEAVDGCGCGCGIISISSALVRDTESYQRFLHHAGEISANERTWQVMKRFEDWQAERGR